MKINPNISQWFTRTAAGGLFGVVGLIFTIMLFTSFGAKQASSDGGTHVVFICILSFAAYGILSAYQLLDLPRVSYLETNNIYYHRIVAMLWFALLSLYVVPPLTINIKSLILSPVIPSLLGLTLGYRILLLPVTLKGFFKAVIIGLIGFVCVEIGFVLLTVPHLNFDGFTFNYIILDCLQDFIKMYIGLLVGLIYFYPQVLAGTILFYFVGLLLNRVSGRSHAR